MSVFDGSSTCLNQTLAQESSPHAPCGKGPDVDVEEAAAGTTCFVVVDASSTVADPTVSVAVRSRVVSLPTVVLPFVLSAPGLPAFWPSPPPCFWAFILAFSFRSLYFAMCSSFLGSLPPPGHRHSEHLWPDALHTMQTFSGAPSRERVGIPPC